MLNLTIPLLGLPGLFGGLLLRPLTLLHELPCVLLALAGVVVGTANVAMAANRVLPEPGRWSP